MMLIKDYAISGITCNQCIKKITNRLLESSSISSVKMQFETPQVTIHFQEALSLKELQQLVSPNKNYVISNIQASPQFEEPAFALAWGVFFAGLIQLLFQLPSLYRLDLVPKPVFDTKDEGVHRILKLMIPALFGVSVSQINLLLDTVLASFLPTGSVSWLYYSDRLAELPLGVFGIAIATHANFTYRRMVGQK